MSSKQVLVLRKTFPDKNGNEKKLRTGKYVSQGAHAAIGALLQIAGHGVDKLIIPLTNPLIKEWIYGSQTKIVCYVNSEKELLNLYEKAKNKLLPFSLIKDEARTELNEPTYTAIAIGPGKSEKIDEITGELPTL